MPVLPLRPQTSLITTRPKAMSSSYCKAKLGCCRFIGGPGIFGSWGVLWAAGLACWLGAIGLPGFWPEAVVRKAGSFLGSNVGKTACSRRYKSCIDLFRSSLSATASGGVAEFSAPIGTALGLRVKFSGGALRYAGQGGPLTSGFLSASAAIYDRFACNRRMQL